jgi:hypothetical protein
MVFTSSLHDLRNNKESNQCLSEISKRNKITCTLQSHTVSTQHINTTARRLWNFGFRRLHIVTYSGFSIHDGTLLHSKRQCTTVKHSRQLLEHTYTSDPHGLGTPTPIEFFQQDLLWVSSITHSNSCSQKASKHKSGQSIVGLSIPLHTTTALRRIVHH